MSQWNDFLHRSVQCDHWSQNNTFVQFQMKVQKCGAFVRIWRMCRGRQRNIQRLTTHVGTAIVLSIKSFVWWHSRGRCHRGLRKLCNECISKFNSCEISSHLCTALDKHIGILSVSLSSHTSHYDRASRNTHSHSSSQHTLPGTRTYRSQTALGMCCS